MLNYIPEHVQKKAFAEYGETLEGAAEAIEVATYQDALIFDLANYVETFKKLGFILTGFFGGSDTTYTEGTDRLYAIAEKFKYYMKIQEV